MEGVQQFPDREAVRFFGTVSASISHEMKNVLAIINENIGLLEDLAEFAENGRPIDPERMKRACRNMTKQIQRGDRIMKNLNTFAHSTDHDHAPVDIYQVAALMVQLAERPAALRSVSLSVMEPAEQIVLHTDRFLLEQCIWLCLRSAVERTETGTELQLLLEKNETGCILLIKGISGDAASHQKSVTGIIPQPMARLLGATVQFAADNHELSLILKPLPE